MIGEQRESGLTFLEKLMVEEKYAPAPSELIELFESVDLSKYIDTGELTSVANSIITLTFNSLVASRLLILKIIAEGFKRQLFSSNASSFFENNLNDDFRIDGGQLNCSEKRDSGDNLQLTIGLKYSDSYDEERKAKYTELVKDAIYEILPKLKGQLDNFKL